MSIPTSVAHLRRSLIDIFVGSTLSKVSHASHSASKRLFVAALAVGSSGFCLCFDIGDAAGDAEASAPVRNPSHRSTVR